MRLQVLDVSKGAVEAIENAGGNVQKLNDLYEVEFPAGTQHTSETYEARQASEYMQEHYPAYAAQRPPLTAIVHRLMLPEEGDILSYTDGYVPADYNFGQVNAVPAPCIIVHESIQARKRFSQLGYKTWKDEWFPN